MHFRISYTMDAEDIFRSSIGCEIMLMIKAKIRLIFSRYSTVKTITPRCRGRPDALLYEAEGRVHQCRPRYRGVIVHQVVHGTEG